jgi:hypothetical protein
MSITELVASAQFVVDAEGNRKAVVLDLPIWEELLNLLDELDDLTDTAAAVAAYQEYKQDPSTARPWVEVEAEFVTKGLLDE